MVAHPSAVQTTEPNVLTDEVVGGFWILFVPVRTVSVEETEE